ALLHLPGRDGVLDGYHHDVAQAGVAALAAAEHADYQRPPGARVVRDPQNRFLLDHGYLALSTTSVTRQRTVFASGRVSMIRRIVCSRAMSRRMARKRIGFSIDSVAERKRRLKRSVTSSSSLAFRSSTDISLISFAFIAQVSSRFTKRVLTGSLAEASAIAFLARSSLMPSISNMTRPGLTTATQPSGLPLPLPMRVSAGFLVTGLSGKIRIHTLPPRFISRVMATREASICRLVAQPGST